MSFWTSRYHVIDEDENVYFAAAKWEHAVQFAHGAMKTNPKIRIMHCSIDGDVIYDGNAIETAYKTLCNSGVIIDNTN